MARAVERKPRVLVVITLAEVGGAQTYVASLLPALVDFADVTVAAHGPGPLREASLAAGARFVPLEHVRRAISPWRDLRGLVELVRLFRRERPDLVHLNSSKAGILGCLAAAAAGVRLRVFTVNGWAFFTFPGRASWLYARLGRVIGLLATQVICVSSREREAGIAARSCRPERSVVIHNAVDVATAPVATPDAEVPRIVSVGRLRWPKDFVTFARALGQLEPGTFSAIAVGDGPDAVLLPPDGPLELLGERDDVPELLASSDVFVLSSRSEGLPLSVLEAMAAGLPVVGSAVGGIPELVADGESGLLVPPGDADALAAALRRLIADRALRVRMGAAGRERARERFDLPAFRQAHLDLYERLLSP